MPTLIVEDVQRPDRISETRIRVFRNTQMVEIVARKRSVLLICRVR